jgi:beta-phosphoglucomutase-like phosphatase (HAD superfamily)
VDKKKPDPKIYDVAAQRLGVDPAECVVVEDSTIGLQAALGAGMRCIITYTPSTKQQVSGSLKTVSNKILQSRFPVSVLKFNWPVGCKTLLCQLVSCEQMC